MNKIFAIAFLSIITGCSHSIHQVYVSSQDPEAVRGGQWVTAEAKAFVVLAFATEANYVEAAYRALESKCPGRLAQVTTEHLTSYKFLSYDQKLILKGLCLKS